MTQHSKFSASGSARWTECTASLELEHALPREESSIYAQVGTAAHELAATALETGKPVGKHKLITTDLKPFIKIYINKVRETAARLKHSKMQIEQRVKYEHIAPGGFGTADAIVYGYNDDDDLEVHIMDLKFGQGEIVYSRENMQIALYAQGVITGMSGFLSELEIEPKISMHIIQPRLDHHSIWQTSLEELNRFTYKAKSAATAIAKGETSFSPSYDTCRWCRVRSQCKARIEALTDWTNLELDVKLATDKEIGDILKKKKHITKLLSDLEEYAFNKAVSDKFEGFKIVEGRTTSKWSDQAEEFLTEKLGQRRFQTRKLITITEARKLVEKNELEKYVTKEAGKPQIVPEDDKRPAIESIEFDDIT